MATKKFIYRADKAKKISSVTYEGKNYKPTDNGIFELVGEKEIANPEFLGLELQEVVS